MALTYNGHDGWCTCMDCCAAENREIQEERESNMRSRERKIAYRAYYGFYDEDYDNDF